MAEEAKNDYFELLKHEFFALRVEWRTFRSFFGTNQETVELLNAISGPTANTLDRILFERVLLGLRRLTDPYEGGRRKTKSVTVKGLSIELSDFDTDLARLVNEAERAAKFARNWSDKRIAHADLNYRNGTSKLEKESRARVEVAIEAIAGVLKLAAQKHFDTHIITHPIPPLRDQKFFLRALYLGQKELEDRGKREENLMSEGNYDALNVLRAEKVYPTWLDRKDPPFD